MTVIITAKFENKVLHKCLKWYSTHLSRKYILLKIVATIMYNFIDVT